jgi:ribosome recycling factor
VKVAKSEAEQARVAMRNIRRDALTDVKELVKEKEITEDDARRAEEDIQKLTDKRIAEVDHALAEKESDLLAI